MRQIYFSGVSLHVLGAEFELIRLLRAGITAVRTGEIPVDVSAHREQLLEIRSGSLSFAEVKSLALDLDRQFQKAFETTRLPDQPDYARVDAFLIRARKRMAQSTLEDSCDRP